MKHITIDRSITDSEDKTALEWWLQSHLIDPAWMTLEQTIDFDDRGVSYTQYRHDDRGALKFQDANATEPLMERVRHICTLRCSGHELLTRLKDLKIEDDHERSAD